MYSLSQYSGTSKLHKCHRTHNLKDSTVHVPWPYLILFDLSEPVMFSRRGEKNESEWP